MEPDHHVSAFVRPAVLEAVLVLTAAAATVVTAMAGSQMGCTALIEFAMLSAIVAASAASLCARYAIRTLGFFGNYRTYEAWASWLRTLCYVAFGLYALLNGVLDLALPRRDVDPISYPGLAGAGLAIIIVTVVLETKYRVLLTLPSRSLLDSLADDAFYIAVGGVTLAALVGHIVWPSWWLDTLIDAVLVVLAAYRVRGLGRIRSAT